MLIFNEDLGAAISINPFFSAAIKLVPSSSLSPPHRIIISVYPSLCNNTMYICKTYEEGLPPLESVPTYTIPVLR